MIEILMAKEMIIWKADQAEGYGDLGLNSSSYSTISRYLGLHQQRCSSRCKQKYLPLLKMLQNDLVSSALPIDLLDANAVLFRCSKFPNAALL